MILKSFLAWAKVQKDLTKLDIKRSELSKDETYPYHLGSYKTWQTVINEALKLTDTEDMVVKIQNHVDELYEGIRGDDSVSDEYKEGAKTYLIYVADYLVDLQQKQKEETNEY